MASLHHIISLTIHIPAPSYCGSTPATTQFGTPHKLPPPPSSPRLARRKVRPQNQQRVYPPDCLPSTQVPETIVHPLSPPRPSPTSLHTPTGFTPFYPSCALWIRFNCQPREYPPVASRPTSTSCRRAIFTWVCSKDHQPTRHC